MATDSDQPTPPPTPESATTPPAAPATPPPPAAKPAGPSRPMEKRRFPPGGGDRGGPRKKVREPVQSLDLDFDTRNRQAPKIRDLDAEIAAELESALQGVDDKNMFAAENPSPQARSQASAPQDQGRKIGRVISIHPPDVFIEVPGGRSQGVLTLENFPEGPPKIGAEVEISIEGYDPTNGLLILSRKGEAVHADWSTVSEGMTVEAKVIETNKGGLSVEINGIRGFMPISQVDRFRVENAEQFVGQKLLCIITEVDKEAHNLIVSRRVLQEKEREEQRKKLWEELAEGQVRTGIIGNVRDFGAFVDLGGIDGLLHVSEISWKRIPDATQVLQAGQQIKVVVLKVDRETQKVSLGLKQLELNPWDTAKDNYFAGRTVKGTVTRTMDFGAFVELEPGIEGLIHISELARNKVWRVTDIVKPGQEVETKILSVDPESRRISLSLRGALPEEVVKKPEDEEEEGAAEEPVKPYKRNYELKGGIGSQVWLTPPEEPKAE